MIGPNLQRQVTGTYGFRERREPVRGNVIASLAIGALTLVYAFRYGQAIVVSPLTNAGAPLMTAVISLLVIGTLPGRLKLVGLVLACIAAVLLAIAPEEATPAAAKTNPIASGR